MGLERARASTVLGATVTVACDMDVLKAEQLASEFPGSKVVHDPGHLDWSSLDAIFVCTPPGSRGPVELEAVQAGVHVFVEKPIGLSAEQSLPLLRALQKQRVVNCVGYMNRYRQTVTHVKQLLAQTVVLGVNFHWIGPRYHVQWWMRPHESGGPFNEQGTHFIDLCRFLIGEITEVYATGPQSDVTAHVDDRVAVTLRFRNGPLGVGLYSCEAAEKCISFGILLTSGHLLLEGWELQLRDMGIEEQNSETKHGIFQKEVAAFFRAIESSDDSPILCDFHDATKTQLVVDAIRRSIVSRAQETVRELQDG